MVSNSVWLKSIRRAADSNPRTSIWKASVMTTRPEGILLGSLWLLSIILLNFTSHGGAEESSAFFFTVS